MKSRRELQNDIIRAMREPDDLRQLRNQADDIERRKAQEMQDFFDDLERTRLRRQISDAGETPAA